LKKIETWTYGKCELYHWVDVLDLCDSILERACRKEHDTSWVLACDLPQNKQVPDPALFLNFPPISNVVNAVFSSCT